MDLFSYLLGIQTGGLIGVLFWIYYLKRRLPRAESNIITKIRSLLPVMIKEAAPEIQKNIKIDWLGVLTEFQKGLSDEEQMKKIMPVLSDIAMIMVVQAQAFMEQDEHFQKWMNGKVARWGEMIYKGAKNKAIKEAGEYGINLKGAEDGTEGLEMDDSIKKIIKMYSMFKQFKGGTF